ncbi:MAG TPA: alanine--tRNA ligase-related protein [Gammaproteobacteria bacterium]|nr:alanine--tRNA ligase-related protein [Gammaproteobacteria bacterium]
MSSIPLYYEDTYHFSGEGIVESLGQDEKGYFIVLDKTLFYPQGGGQPSDRGHVIFEGKKILIHAVKVIDKQIRHYTDAGHPEILHKPVILNIDPDARIMHATLHTAGHLVSNAVEDFSQDFTAIKGHHFPGECYVEFSIVANSRILDLNVIQQRIDVLIDQSLPIQKRNVSADQLESICPGLPYTIPQHELVRLIKIGSFAYQPCGGTHLHTLSGLKGLKLTKQKIKGNKIKIYYNVN